MLDDVIGFLFSALLGIVLLVVVALLARRSMVKAMQDKGDKAGETDRKRAGEAESSGASSGPNQG